jgi:2'-5' RNA ligase superfamily
MVELLAATESLLLVPVPEATLAVHAHRLRFDLSARLGVPEHITLLYPFLPPDELDTRVHLRLFAIFASVRSFEFRLTAIRWFDNEVMWLAP